MKHTALFFFHGYLSDFLPDERRGQALVYRFSGTPGIKDAIEALGVPHSEVAHILANDLGVGFRYPLRPDDRISLFSEQSPIEDSSSPLRHPLALPATFIVDVNLGKLARWLRLLGFDVRWRNDLKDREIVDISVAEQRIILTRDRRLLFHREIEYGYWIRAVEPDLQVPEIIDRLDLWRDVSAFRRCALCNGLIQVVAKAQILDKLEPLTRKHYDDFYQCATCGQIYWKGSHYDKLLKKLETFKHHA